MVLRLLKVIVVYKETKSEATVAFTVELIYYTRGVTIHVTGRDTDSMPDSYSRPLARQGAVTAVLRLFRDEVCGREEWTGEEKADNIKSQGQETQLGVLGTPRQGINTCQGATMSL